MIRSNYSVQADISSLRSAVDECVKELMCDYKHILVSNPKVIHDSVHGTNIFQPHEIAFLDLPIIQRLRRISQTDVASYVFPAGNHNRFEHTVGAAVVAGNMVDSIYSKADNALCSGDKDFIYNNCRVAAILHDCGHGPYSHLTEQIYAPQFKKIKEENEIFKGASAHEILSYLITTSAPIREFNDNVIYKEYGKAIDLNFIGTMIVGYIDKEKDKQRGYAIEVINSAFDADKLDYILRDAHATGIRMALDLPRLMYTLNVIPDSDGVNRLAIDISGVAALESIIFNKMMLTSTIYHHQKVRAVGCMLKGIIDKSGLFTTATEYLKYTDDQIISMASDNYLVKKQLYMLKNRMIPKRAFCFSSRTLEDATVLRKLMQNFDDNEFKKNVIANIAEYTKKEFGHYVKMHEIWIDSPSTPKFKEATQCLIRSEGSENDYIRLSDVFPTDDWVRAFSENKWQGFVYAMPESCRYVAAASRYVFEEIFKAKFNSFSTKLCKIDDLP